MSKKSDRSFGPKMAEKIAKFERKAREKIQQITHTGNFNRANRMEAYNGMTIVATLLAGFAISILVTDDSAFVDSKDSWSNHATTISAVIVVCLNLLATVTLGYILFMVRFIAPETEDPKFATKESTASPAPEKEATAESSGAADKDEPPIILSRVDSFWALTEFYRKVSVYSMLFSVPIFLFCILTFIWGKFGVVTTDKSSYNGPAIVSIVICGLSILASLFFFSSISIIARLSASIEEDPLSSPFDKIKRHLNRSDSAK